ncbi:MAG: YjjG family noncanonical pyrimidine nucleotidase [Anaerofustis sp.]
MKYDIIFFDADDTLFDFQQSEAVAYRNAMNALHLPYADNESYEIYRTVNHAIWREFEEGKISQSRLKTERFRRLADRLNISFDAAEFAKEFMYQLSRASILFDDAIPLIEDLKRHAKLLIVTNGLSDVQHRRVRGSVIADSLSGVIISEEAGVAKPDPAIFELAARQVQASDKSKMLMVGDGLKSDILGGINYGIDTCWYNPKRLQNESGVVPTYEINTLPQLIPIAYS